ncbi:hypothetical protein Tdes44962_MAKER10368, partial [Teratosphaeria destructans]
MVRLARRRARSWSFSHSDRNMAWSRETQSRRACVADSRRSARCWAVSKCSRAMGT